MSSLSLTLRQEVGQVQFGQAYLALRNVRAKQLPGHEPEKSPGSNTKTLDYLNNNVVSKPMK